MIGQGDQGPDIQSATFGAAYDCSFELRAERETGQNTSGRTYTVTYRVTDTVWQCDGRERHGDGGDEPRWGLGEKGQRTRDLFP